MLLSFSSDGLEPVEAILREKSLADIFPVLSGKLGFAGKKAGAVPDIYPNGLGTRLEILSGIQGIGFFGGVSREEETG